MAKGCVRYDTWLENLLTMTEVVAEVPAPRGFALWNLGFRPFYLLAGLFATLSVPVWMAQYAG